MLVPEAWREGERQMRICNACRYCEGYCAVFPAMLHDARFSPARLAYLANLCHDCRACYYACQYAPPHEFAVNVPELLGALRTRSYAQFAWPAALAGAFRRNGLLVTLVAAAALAVVLALVFTLVDPAVLHAAHRGSGAFYAVIPHLAMVLPAGAVFGFALLAMAIGFGRCWRAGGTSPPRPDWRALRRAARDAATLRYLDGGGDGCNYPDARFSHARRRLHHLTAYGFALCFAATVVATGYHYLLGLPAPHALVSWPVLLGTAGGLGLIAGPAGLLWLRRRRDPPLLDASSEAMDVAFLALLLAVSATGLALLALRATAFMGPLLALHLGTVLGLFLALPYGKLMHAVYRFAALLRFAVEQPRPPRGGA